MNFNVYQKINPYKLLDAGTALVVAAALTGIAYFRFFSKIASLIIYGFAGLAVIVALVFLFSAIFIREIALHADEKGILSTSFLYIPWEFIDKIYLRPEYFGDFLEIKISDREGFLKSLGQDGYDMFSDDFDTSYHAGHEMFYFELDSLTMKSEKIVNRLYQMKEAVTGKATPAANNGKKNKKK